MLLTFIQQKERVICLFLTIRNRRKGTSINFLFLKNICIRKVKAEEGKPFQLQCRGQANVYLAIGYHKSFRVSIFLSSQTHYKV